MVSLSDGRTHSHSFADLEDGHGHIASPANHGSTERLLDQQPSAASFFTSTDNISSIPTTWAAILQAFFIVAFEVAIFLLSDVWKVQVLGGLRPPFALLTAIHVGLWLIAVLLDRYMHYHHRMLRTFGYLDFYTKTKDIRRLPLWILSLGNAVLLVIVSILDRPSSSVNLVHLFKIIVSAELGIALIATIVYLVKVVKFNKARRLPDAFRQNVVDGFSADMYSSPEIGFRDQDGLDEVLEKQTEMIRYLQQHNANLGKKIVEMTQQSQQHDKRGR